jgi:hypothetical protein
MNKHHANIFYFGDLYFGFGIDTYLMFPASHIYQIAKELSTATL